MDQNEQDQNNTENEQSPYHTKEDVIEEHSDEKVGNPSLFGMITSPSEQFKKMIHHPKFAVAIIIVTLFTFVGALLTLANFSLPEEMMTEFDADGIQLISIITKIILVLAGLIGPIFGILISTAIYFIVAKLLKSEITFKQTFSMFSYISIISAIAALINGIIMVLAPNLPVDTVVTSLGSLVQTGDVLQAVLNSIEIFAIWQLIVTAIGLQIVAKLSKPAAWTTVIVIFMLGLVFQMISAAFNSFTAI